MDQSDDQIGLVGMELGKDTAAGQIDARQGQLLAGDVEVAGIGNVAETAVVICR